MIPTLLRKLLEHNQVKMALTSWQWLTAFESIAVIALFVWVGFWIGYEATKDDSKTFDRIREDYRKDLKEHYDKLRASIVEVEKENGHLKTLVDGLKSEIHQRERIIKLLNEAFNEEKERNKRTPEEANKQALEAIS